MAVHKCNYIIFHNSNQAPNDLKLTMNNQSIKRVAEATFLGITLDEKLKFRSHIDQIKKKSTSRLNIIKILSHSSWKLSKTTLINLYNTIIRSIFEYSSILVTALDTKAIQALQVIQNSALRSILHLQFDKEKKKHTRINKLHEIAQIPMVKARLSELKSNYLNSAIRYSNPIITKCIEEFKQFGIARSNPPTLLNLQHITVNQESQENSQINWNSHYLFIFSDYYFIFFIYYYYKTAVY